MNYRLRRRLSPVIHLTVVGTDCPGFVLTILDELSRALRTVGVVAVATD